MKRWLDKEILIIMDTETLDVLDPIQEPEKAAILIVRYRKTVRHLRLYLRICFLGWLLTVLSGAIILYTGKFPPIELEINTPKFGSVYQTKKGM